MVVTCVCAGRHAGRGGAPSRAPVYRVVVVAWTRGWCRGKRRGASGPLPVSGLTWAGAWSSSGDRLTIINIGCTASSTCGQLEETVPLEPTVCSRCLPVQCSVTVQYITRGIETLTALPATQKYEKESKLRQHKKKKLADVSNWAVLGPILGL